MYFKIPINFGFANFSTFYCQAKTKAAARRKARKALGPRHMVGSPARTTKAIFEQAKARATAG